MHFRISIFIHLKNPIHFKKLFKFVHLEKFVNKSLSILDQLNTKPTNNLYLNIFNVFQ